MFTIVDQTADSEMRGKNQDTTAMVLFETMCLRLGRALKIEVRLTVVSASFVNRKMYSIVDSWFY